MICLNFRMLRPRAKIVRRVWGLTGTHEEGGGEKELKSPVSFVVPETLGAVFFFSRVPGPSFSS